MFPPVEELIAHRGNMLLVDRVLSFSRGRVQVAATAIGNAWYADADGAMPAWIGIELMAQTISVLASLSAHEKGILPKHGLLLGTRCFSAYRPSFPQNTLFVVTATEIFQETNGLGAFNAHIEVEGVIVSEATLKVFEPVDISTILTPRIA